MKKIISIILCLGMLIPVVPVFASEINLFSTDDLEVAQVYYFNEDFDNATADTLVFSDAELVSDGENGNYIKSTIYRASANVNYPTDGKYTVEFDTKFGKDDGGYNSVTNVFIFDIGLTEYAETSTDVNIMLTDDYADKGIDLSKWYTFRITVDKDKGFRYNASYGRIFGDAITVEWKGRGTEEWKTAYNMHHSYDYTGAELCYSISGNYWQYVGADMENEGVGFTANMLVDNVKVYAPGVMFQNGYFTTGGLETTTIPDGSAVVGVAELQNTAKEEKTVMGIVRVYNSREEVVRSTTPVNWTVAADSTQVFTTESVVYDDLIDVSHIDLIVTQAGDSGEFLVGKKMIYSEPVIVDDSTDGYVEWAGWIWDAICIREDARDDAIYDTIPCQHGWIYVDDNDYLNFRLEPNGDTNGKHHRIDINRWSDVEGNYVELADNFDFEFDMKVYDYGEALGYQHYGADYRVYLVFTKDNIIYQSADGFFNKNIAIGYDWNTFRSEKRGRHFSLYMNDELLLTYELPYLDNTNGTGAIRFYGTPYKKVAPNFQLRSMKLEPYENTMDMIPDYNQVFYEGESIEFKANMDDSPERVDYYVGKVKIGSATADSEYSFTLTDAPVGSYTVQAKAIYADGSEKHTFARTITVENPNEIVVICPQTVNYGESAEFSIDNSSGLDIDHVNYYVNGVLMGSSAEGELSYSASGMRVGTNSVYGVVYLADGSYITTETELIDVKASGDAGKLEIGQEYDLSHNFGGGNGEISLKDGYFELNMSHSADGVTYQTRDGVETYSAPNGVYRAIVTSGVADVYRDGQLAFSYFMPGCRDAASLAYSGISDVKLGGSGVKAEVFRRELSGEKDFTEDNLNMDLYYSLEFDKTDSSSETILLYDGEYEISLKFNGGISVLEQPRSEWETAFKTICDTVESGYYRVTVYRGLGQVFLNNKFLGSFRAPKTSHKATIRRTMSVAGASTFTSIKNTDDIFYFEDDFQGDNDLPWDEYWYKFYGDTVGTVADGKLTLSGDGVYLLDATAENPTLTWNMTIPEGDTGEVSILTRFRNNYKNMKIVCNLTDGSWNFVDTDKGVETTIATVSKSLETGREYAFILDIKDDLMTLSCDGEEIFSKVECSYPGNGKYGFELSGQSSIVIDNVTYVGNGKTNTGVNYAFWPDNEFSGTLEFIDLSNEQEGTVGIFFLNKVTKTTDDGETWSATEDYTGKGYGSNSIILRSGRRLTISDWGYQSHANLVEADGTVVASNVVIQAKDDLVADRHGMQGRLTQGRKVWGNATEPRVFYVTSEGSETNGTTRVYYSDDEGLSWTETRTNLTYSAMGDFYAGEADIVELPDGTVRVWLRCDRGFLYYLDSYDGGENFELKPVASQLMTPSTAFSIERDSEEPNTYYIIWTNDTTTAALQYIQQPRNRESIAVSYDGCETWEYIMEMDDRGIYPTTDFCNASMRVIDGKVYANHGYLEGGQFKMDEITTINQITYTLDPAKFKSVKRFANAHYIRPDFTTVYDEMPSQAILPKTTGTAMLYSSMTSARAEDGMVESAVVARAVGANLTADESGIKLTLGDGVVSFTKGSASYEINGETFTASDICLSEDGEYLNVKVCAEIFGKIYSETTSAHMLMTAALSETYKSELESFVAGVPEALKICIEDFKTIGSVSDLKEFFEEYKVLLNLYTGFTDKSYENMYNAYTQLDLEAITDYETMTAAIDSLTYGEKGRVDEFLAALNVASAEGDWESIETYLTEVYSDVLSFAIDTVGVNDPSVIYKRMTGITYNSVEEVESVFNAAYRAQLYLESGESNALSISTVSKGIESWTSLGSNDFGGVSLERVDNDNIITLSAFEKIIDDEKAQVEAPLENGLVYNNPGGFAENTVTQSGVTVDAESGSVTFGGERGSFTLTGAENAKSSTVIYVFDMKKPSGTVKGTFDSGVTKTEVTFDETGCSLGELNEEMKAAEELTYRVELSQLNVTVYAKNADAPDTDYILLGTGSMALHTRSKWSVMFETEDAETEISNIGVYSALSSVKYDVSGYEQVFDMYYSVDGDEGHTIADMIATGLTEDGSIAEDGSLKLIESAGATPPRGTFVMSKGTFGTMFERSEIDMTVQVEDGGTIFLYFLDSSGFRYYDGSFSPDRLNGKSAYSGLTWKTGQYYDIKLITSPAGYDENGQTRTSACMYAKREEDSDWICIGQDIILTVGDKSEGNLQLAIMNCREKEAVYIKSFSMKNYAKPAGSYEFVNSAANMPEVDYVFSFDYNRMDSDTPTQFTMGGADYCQSFTMEPYRITSLVTDNVTADIDVEEDKWYRIYGCVKMTEESTQAFDKTKILKNTITMYMEDAEGNVTEVFRDLPMLKKTGNNGLRFRMSDSTDAGIRLKNVRVYNGRALDLVLAEAVDGTANITADFLNDEAVFAENVTLYGGAYEELRLVGAKVGEETALDVAPFGYERMSLSDISYTTEGTEPQLKLFMWKSGVPVTPAVNSKL